MFCGCLDEVEKKREVSHLVRENCLLILCIQETKLTVCNNTVCKSLWDNTHVDFSYQPSMGASEGLFTLWDNKEVEVWSSIFF